MCQLTSCSVEVVTFPSGDVEYETPSLICLPPSVHSTIGGGLAPTVLHLTWCLFPEESAEERSPRMRTSVGPTAKKGRKWRYSVEKRGSISHRTKGRHEGENIPMSFRT